MGAPAGAPAPALVAPVESAGETRARLRLLIAAAKQKAPEVSMARASLTSSRSAHEMGRMAPFLNPMIEVTAERGNREVTKDVAINGILWLPVELSGQRGSRKREATDFVGLHTALVDQARAHAAARLVRAFGYATVAAERWQVLTELLTSSRAEADLMAERVKVGDAVARDASLAAVEAARHEVMLAETQAELVRSQGELSELLGTAELEQVPPTAPPSLSQNDFRTVKVDQTPQSQALRAQAKFYSSSAERLSKEGQSALSLGLVAGRGDYGETRLGGGLAYAFPVFRANRPERARAAAESSRALEEKRVQESVVTRRLKLLQLEQEQLTRAIDSLTTTAVPAARYAVSAVQETYAAGKAEMLAVLLSRRELSSLYLRRLELLQQNWLLV
ncbi:MAG: Heavy metal efflux outer membrane protein CzcC family protein, partial [Polyangiaceae bacterium]|nr:Heavy metal efflux outer membrane protein CzcC family protein [Polyangiaceae bacterium]